MFNSESKVFIECRKIYGKGGKVYEGCNASRKREGNIGC